MKLKIIDYFWAVGHWTKRKGSHKILLAEGESREINYVQFRIDKVEKDKAQISVIRRDGTVIKEITVEKSKPPLLYVVQFRLSLPEPIFVTLPSDSSIRVCQVSV